jgi:hypothetical protein
VRDVSEEEGEGEEMNHAVGADWEWARASCSEGGRKEEGGSTE